METSSSAASTGLVEKHSRQREVATRMPMLEGNAGHPTKPPLEAIVPIIAGAEPDVAAAVGAEAGSPFGAFVGLRSVFLLYMGAGIAAALGYEMWCVLTR